MVGPSSEMSDLQIFPPLFNENEEFKSIVSKCKFFKTSKQVSPEQVVKDVHSMSNLLLDHPMPYYQVTARVQTNKLYQLNQNKVETSFSDYSPP